MADDEAKIEDVPLAAEAIEGELPPLGPVTQSREKVPSAKLERPDPSDPAALQKAGQSPADLELPARAVGKPILVKQNPETPSPHQIGAGITSQQGPPDVTVTVTDGEGNEIPHRLGTDDLTMIQQRAEASLIQHPAHQTVGYSNPQLRDMTDEEREADEKAYQKRFGGKAKAKASA